MSLRESNPARLFWEYSFPFGADPISFTWDPKTVSHLIDYVKHFFSIQACSLSYENHSPTDTKFMFRLPKATRVHFWFQPPKNRNHLRVPYLYLLKHIYIYTETTTLNSVQYCWYFLFTTKNPLCTDKCKWCIFRSDRVGISVMETPRVNTWW